MRLWCYFFGHILKRPKAEKGGIGLFTSCKRCGTFMVRDYFDRWQPATQHEKAYYLRVYAPKPEQENGDAVAGDQTIQTP